MKKLKFLIAAMIIALPLTSYAQTEAGDEEDDEVVVVDETDEYDETDEESKEIDMPEGLTEELDSLLSAYYNEHYLQTDADCNFSDVNPTYSTVVDRIFLLEV